MSAYANLHLALEAMRVRAIYHTKNENFGGETPPHYGNGESTEPPRVLILGPENSGKTTITKILVNYATRVGQDWMPMLVNVDPSEVILYTPIQLRAHRNSHHTRVDACFRARFPPPPSRCLSRRRHLLTLLALRPRQLLRTCRRTRCCRWLIGTDMPIPNGTPCC
jgi:hypothetical protein